MMNAIEFLKHEHQTAKAAFTKVLDASPGKRGELWKQLTPELRAHEQIEDAGLYQPLSRDAATTDSRLAGWRHQHRAEVEKVEGLMNEIERLRPEDQQWLAKVKEVHSGLETHIKEEEGEEGAGGLAALRAHSVSTGPRSSDPWGGWRCGKVDRHEPPGVPRRDGVARRAPARSRGAGARMHGVPASRRRPGRPSRGIGSRALEPGAHPRGRLRRSA